MLQKNGVDTEKQSSPFILEEELDMKMIQAEGMKKENVAMWDEIDALTMKFVQDLQDAGLGGQHLDDEYLIEATKKILDLILPVVEDAAGNEFVFVDCNH